MFDDNNYIHTNLSVIAASTNAAVVPNVNVAVVGTYPNYYLQFTSLDIAADENVEFEFETIENGVYTNYELFYADVIANPTATITYTNNEVCENEGIVNLIPHGSPAGGFWTGPGVTTINSKFNPDVANPGTHTINYTYFNSYGCYDTESASVIVHPVPNVTVTTTPANCGVEDGTANATITGGTPAYTIYWSNGSILKIKPISLLECIL
ncbi:MAG: SprB repeat-containing protein [Crocinitomicaceae bacterium]|nr:SprB repeat-containing protein [Crocinitomicaceae bacterium]